VNVFDAIMKQKHYRIDVFQHYRTK